MCPFCVVTGSRNATNVGPMWVFVSHCPAGSATATLEHSPGTSVSVFITYLTPVLQQRMHETEGAYHLCRLDEVQLLEGLSLQQHM